MRSQHMTQQMFANYIGIAPATLSSIVNERTKPTLNIVEAIWNKLPNISMKWLLFGEGSMYDTDGDSESASLSSLEPSSAEPSLFPSTSPTAPSPSGGQKSAQMEVVKYVDKPQRKITEIRIFYDDQTWETFVAKK